MACDCIDYPVSWPYWRSHCIEQHGYDPGSNEMPEEKETPIIEPQWNNRQWDKVQQLESEVRGWRQKHAESLKDIDRLNAKAEDGNKKYIFTE